MSSERSTLVDFIARTNSQDKWRMVLVEEGPWSEVIEFELARIQDRLYGCIDAAIDGQLADQFPELSGAHIIIQLDCYNVPEAEVHAFFDEFSSGVFLIPDYKEALRASSYVSGISFEINFE